MQLGRTVVGPPRIGTGTPVVSVPRVHLNEAVVLGPVSEGFRTAGILAIVVQGLDMESLDLYLRTLRFFKLPPTEQLQKVHQLFGDDIDLGVNVRACPPPCENVTPMRITSSVTILTWA